MSGCHLQVCGQRFRAKGSMLFHQKLRHNMDVKLNKALEERYLQIVANQRQKQMREERKKAALSSKDSAAWFQHEMQSWMLQNHLQNRVIVGMAAEEAEGGAGGLKTEETKAACPTATAGSQGARDSSAEGGAHVEYSGTTNVNAEQSQNSGGVGSSSNLRHTEGITTKDDKELSSKEAVVPATSVGDLSGVCIKSEHSETAVSQRRLPDVNGNIETVTVDSSSFESEHVHKNETSHEGGLPVDEGGPMEVGHSGTTLGSSLTQMELSVDNVNRLREMMFTPELQSQTQVEGFDDNCNLKENLDKLIMKAFGKLGLESYAEHLPADGNGQQGEGPSHNASQGGGTSSASSTSVSPHGQIGSQSGSGSGGHVAGHGPPGEEDFTIDYPSVFPGLKRRMKVCNETVIVTRLDGVNVSGGDKVSLYKCYLCSRIFRELSLLQCHLSTHFERQLTFYECLYCDAHFKFKAQLLQHLRLSHEVDYAPGDLPLEGEGEGPSEGEFYDLEPESQPEIGPLQEGVYIDTNTRHPPTTTSTPAPLSQKGKHYSGTARKQVNGLYVCRFCNKTFERSFSLIRHERMHTGYKPCVCRHCGRGFSEPRNLRQHTARFHAHQGKYSSQSRAFFRQRLGRVGVLYAEETSTKAGFPQQDGGAFARFNTQEDSNNSEINTRVSVSSLDKMAMDTAEKAIEEEEESLRTEANESGSMLEESGSTTASMLRLDSSEIANEIREKERLGDDVTVVIPSEPPLDTLRERSQETPRSITSENTTWSNISEVDSDLQGAEIISAPVRSLISTFKPKRRPSYPGGGGSGSNATVAQQVGSETGATSTTTTKPRASSPQTVASQVPQASSSSEIDPQGSLLSQEGGSITGDGRAARSQEEQESKASMIVIAPDTPTLTSGVTLTTTTTSGSSYTSTPQGAAPSGMASPFGPLSVSTFLNPAGLPGE